MRNCLPKIFRTKSSSSSSSARAAAAHSNELETDADTERYIIAKATAARKTSATTTTTSTVTTTTDQQLDNDNKKLQWAPATASTTTTTTTATATTSTTSCADDVDKSRLISAVSTTMPNSSDLEQSNNSRNSRTTASNGSIRPVLETNATSEIKVAGIVPGAAPLPVPVRLPGNSSKTPEQMELEYEANEAAEGRDIMTPLLRNTRSLSMAFGGSNGGSTVGAGSGVGRIMQPEIVEAIRNLDTQALLLNNLTLEDRIKLTAQQQQEDKDGVPLRSKSCGFDRQCHSLYERRLHKGPKLRLWVGNGKKPSPQSEEDEFKTFQVFG